jgi:hypothetical protein
LQSLLIQFLSLRGDGTIAADDDKNKRCWNYPFAVTSHGKPSMVEEQVISANVQERPCYQKVYLNIVC